MIRLTSSPWRGAEPNVRSERRYFFLDASARSGGVAFGGCEWTGAERWISRRRPDCLVLVYVAEGEGGLRLNGTQMKSIPGVFFASADGDRWSLLGRSGQPMLTYFIQANRGAAMLQAAGLRTGQVTALSDPAEVRRIAENVIREGRRQGAVTNAMCHSLIQLLLLKIAALSRRATNPESVAWANFIRVKTMIENQPARLKSLREIARSAGLDSSSICRLFRRFHTCGPYQHLMRKKMNLAAEYILGPPRRLKDTARRVGFSDPENFARRFKTAHGVSPADLLRYSGGGPIAD